MNRKTKEEIYKKWVQYCTNEGMPVPEYAVHAYTDETIELWERVMK